MNPQSHPSWFKIVSAAACAALLALPLCASAGIAEDVNWLSTQPNADGSFGAGPAAIAEKVQSTAEVLSAYQANLLLSKMRISSAMEVLFLEGDNR